VDTTPTKFLTSEKQYITYPRSTVRVEELTVTQLVEKFSAFYGTRWFITVFTTAKYWFV
jgi:hypothetical protein